MIRHVHVVTGEYPPIAGGLEAWTQSFASRAVDWTYRVTVYVCGEQESVSSQDPRVELVPLAPLRYVWEAPLAKIPFSEPKRVAERSRLDFLILRNEISRRVSQSPNASHVLLSNFALGVGHLTALVTEDLNLPHVACVVGTDFSRGYRNHREREMLRHVCRHARKIVCRSTEQATKLQELAGSCKPEVILTSVAVDESGPVKERSPGAIRIFADCGLSYHKGTNVLLETVESLFAEQLPISVALCGSVAAGQEEYWDARLARLRHTSGDGLAFVGQISVAETRIHLEACDLYCSATLGEGCSAGRVAALCAGRAIVTTRCGEFWADVNVDGAEHIAIVQPGDAASFQAAAREMVKRVLSHTVRIDPRKIAAWRLQFSGEHEWSRWRRIFEGIE